MGKRDRAASARDTLARRITRWFVALSLGAATLLTLSGPAHAACHAFTVEVDPSDPTEGTTVAVTIRRDAAVQPSSVRVRTVDATATGGQDYTGLDERVEFTDGTEQTREVDVLDDEASEDAETFTIELSDGQGCEVNQNFTYDSATVTIQDDDPAAQASPTPTAQASPTPTQTPAAQETSDADTTEDELPETGTGMLLAVLGLSGLLAGGGLLRWRRSERH